MTEPNRVDGPRMGLASQGPIKSQSARFGHPLRWVTTEARIDASSARQQPIGWVSKNVRLGPPPVAGQKSFSYNVEKS
jgi:hypothetical protein